MKKHLIGLLALLLSVSLLKAVNCPNYGDATDDQRKATNILKNRSTIPQQSDFVQDAITVQQLLNSADDPNAFDQTKAVTITGYLVKANKEKGESCNCHATDDAHHDIHIFIAPNRDVTSIGQCVVVEVTPYTKGIRQDLTYEYLNSLQGHQVSVTGYLLYDWEHTSVSAASNPDLEKPQRGTVWEVHPITELEDIDVDMAEATSGKDKGGNKTPAVVVSASSGSGGPGDMLTIILLGAILGAVGQMLRIIPGLKQMNDEAVKQQVEVKEVFELQQLLISLLIAVCIGTVAGVLAALQSDHLNNLQKGDYLLFVGAGYAGTDFIEGFIKKYPQVKGTDNTDNPQTEKAKTPPRNTGGQGGIVQ